MRSRLASGFIALRAAQVLMLGLFLAACGGRPQNVGSAPSTVDFWEAREGQSVTFLDRNGRVVYDHFELLDGDRYCGVPTPQTTCIELSTSTQQEAQARAEHYGGQLERQGWQRLLTGNQYSHDAVNGCHAIISVGATIQPDNSADWSEIGFIQSVRCEEPTQ